jgi:hypothetical protein
VLNICDDEALIIIYYDTHTHTHTIHTHLYIYIYTYIYAYIYAYIYICICIWVHTHTHTHAHIQPSPLSLARTHFPHLLSPGSCRRRNAVDPPRAHLGRIQHSTVVWPSGLLGRLRTVAGWLSVSTPEFPHGDGVISGFYWYAAGGQSPRCSSK